MKMSTLLLIATFMFGLQLQDVNATPINAEWVSAEMDFKGNVTISYEDRFETLYVKLAQNAVKGRTLITVYNSLGKVVAKEVLKATGKATLIKVDLAGTAAGEYKVHIETDSWDFSDRFQKK